MTISAWAAWNEAVLTEPFPKASQNQGMSGDRLPNAAKVSGSLDFDQEVALSSGIVGFGGATVSYIGDRISYFQPTAARQVFPAYARTDLRLGLRYESWSGSVYVNNVADRRGVLFGGIGTFNPTAFNYIQPRTAGVSVAKKF
jgi:hypothetical protein